MDTSNPAVFVNAELLRLYVGRRVRALIQVVRTEGGTVIGKSTDENQLVVKGSPPFPLTKFVEVIGIADGEKSIHADIWNNFGETIGMPFPPTFCKSYLIVFHSNYIIFNVRRLFCLDWEGGAESI
ncbi:unnamed protein product [Prunus armeniaca]